jgi:hypothetical protein
MVIGQIDDLGIAAGNFDRTILTFGINNKYLVYETVRALQALLDIYLFISGCSELVSRKICVTSTPEESSAL